MEEKHINPHTDLEFKESINAYRDILNAINTAKRDSFAEGKAEGKIEIARIMLSDGESVAKIARYTGLLEAEIEKLKNCNTDRFQI